MLVILLLLAVPVTAVALWVARREYSKYGKLTAFGLTCAGAMLLVPNLMLEYATMYRVPDTAVSIIGVIVGVFGLTVCLVSIFAFRSVPKVFGFDAGELTVAGLYRWSRNPQYVGWFLFLLGFALLDWSLWCLAAMLVVAIELHLLVLVEEEHLRRVFGEPFVQFCRTVPRYFGWGAASAAEGQAAG